MPSEASAAGTALTTSGARVVTRPAAMSTPETATAPKTFAPEDEAALLRGRRLPPRRFA
jgi:hypothetical protein